MSENEVNLDKEELDRIIKIANRVFLFLVICCFLVFFAQKNKI